MTARFLTKPFKLVFQSPSSRHLRALLRDSEAKVDASAARCVAAGVPLRSAVT
jgi:hypothetical protein